MENIEPEIKAMGEVFSALKGLESDEVRQRVLHWAASKFSLARPAQANVQPTRTLDETSAKDYFSRDFSLADAFEKAVTKTDSERVLIAAAFLQENQNKQELTGFEINSELKNLGLKASNITDAISALMAKKPQLMIQTKKEGSSKQAKKKYRVTVEGFKVATRLSSGVEVNEQE